VTALVTVAGIGCGARTGLAVPDGGFDASPDGSLDAAPDGPVDAGRDAMEPPVCVEVPPGASGVTVSLTLPVALSVVDVLFLLDATGSMVDEISNIRAGLRRRVVPGVRASIPDAAFGVAYVGEFPEPPHGPEGVRPYELRAPVTLDVVRVEGALERSPRWGNFDQPEAQVEGLFQAATGEGLGPWIAPSSGCPAGGSGGACFRRDALPVVLLATDAPFHNGPPGVPPVEPYRFAPEPHSYREAVDALSALDALVLGLGARDFGSASPLPHLRAIARDTGAVDERGEPLVFDIGSRGGRIGDSIVRAIERLADGVPLDVDAIVQDVPGDPFDARTLVRRVRPVEARPSEGVEAIEESRFVGVVPGTEVTFELVIDATDLEPSPVTRRIPARVRFRAFERSRLGVETVLIVVPGEDGGGCSGP
jgi:hypothetical protein